MGTKSKKKQSNTFTELVNLTPAELARLPKPRDGFMAFVEPLLQLYASHVTQLPITGRTPATARAELAAYQALLVQEAEAQRQLALISETRALRAAGVWTTQLDIYASARNAGRHDASMLHAVDGFARFLRYRRKNAATVAPVVTPPAVAPPVVTPPVVTPQS